MSCKIDLIESAADKCAFVKENCHMEVQIPFTQLFYCHLDENLFILMFIGITLCIVVFHFLSLTVDNYLAKSLTNISKYFNMSQTLAGVTLVALGNGSGDLMGAFVGVDADILVSVGSIFGGVLFITTFVFARVLQVSGKIALNPTAIKRDVIFNMIGTSCIIIFACIGYINYVMSAAFVGLYFIYIIVVLQNEKTMKKEEKEIQQNKCLQEIEGDVIVESEKKQQESPNLEEGQPQKSPEQNIVSQDTSPFKALQPNPEQQSLLGKNAINEKLKTKNPEQSLEQQEKSWQEMSSFDKFLFIYDFPFDLLRQLLIPQCDEKKWNKKITLIHCFTFPPTVLFLTDMLFVSVFNVPLLVFLWIITGVFAIYVQLKSSNDRLPGFFIGLMFTGAFVAIFIIKLCVEAIVDFLLLFQILTGISYTYIGMTVLALGNSIADYCTNIQVARMGFGIMAVTACFAGCIFNVLLGFGLALVKLTWLNEFMGKIDFKLFQDTGAYPTNTADYDEFMNKRYNNSVAITLLFFALTNLVVTFVIIQVKNYRLTKRLSPYYFIFYGSFLFMVTLLSVLISYLIKYTRPEYFW